MAPNPSSKRLRLDKNQKTNNLIIGKIHYRNPQKQISNYRSIILVINISWINTDI